MTLFIVLSSCMVHCKSSLGSRNDAVWCHGGNRLEKLVTHLMTKSLSSCGKRAIITNPKAGTHFAVPRRVTGGVDPDTAGKGAVVRAEKPQSTTNVACQCAPWLGSNPGLLRDVRKRTKPVPLLTTSFERSRTRRQETTASLAPALIRRFIQGSHGHSGGGMR